MAQGPCVHSDRSAAPAAVEFGSCDDSHAHWAGHSSSAQGPCTDLCSICQLRSQPALVTPAVATLGDRGTAAVLEFASVSLPPRQPLRNRCRAPPRV